jgi:hypothetical protein
MADTLALGASAARREGSSPFIPTRPHLFKFSITSFVQNRIYVCDNRVYKVFNDCVFEVAYSLTI